MKRYRRIITRPDYVGMKDEYPHWQKGYEFNALSDGPEFIESEDHHIHLKESCEEIK